MGEVQGMGPDPKSIIPVANLSAYSVFGEGSSHRGFMIYAGSLLSGFAQAHGKGPCSRPEPMSSGLRKSHIATTHAVRLGLRGSHCQDTSHSPH